MEGKSEINNLFKKSKNPLVIIGESALELKSGKYILEGLKDFLHKNKFINENWNSFNILSQNAATVGALDLNFLNKAKILKKIEHFLFEDNQKYGPIKGFVFLNILIALLLFFTNGLESVLMFEPYFLYLYFSNYMCYSYGTC